MVEVLTPFEKDPVEMRAAYCQTLLEEARRNPRIVMMNCDLASSMGLKDFERAFPERSINVGIQEANGCAMCGGMSAAGLIPFFNTFGVFASRRICDQIFMSCAYQNLNVKIVGGDAGVSAAVNGGTHMALEDMGILRVLPKVTVLEPSDTVMMRQLVRQMAATYGVQYIRFARKTVDKLYTDDSRFNIGKGAVIREGGDAAIIACGLLVKEALLAAERLAVEGVQVRVVDMFTVKPIDTDCVIESAEKTGAIVTAENHQVIGGLGSAVSEVLAENCPVPMERIGVKDRFGEVGTQEYLMERFGLTASHIVAAVKRTIARKNT